jgi:hypothetical protein
MIDFASGAPPVNMGSKNVAMRIATRVGNYNRRVAMRNTVVTLVATSTLVAAIVGMPSGAQSQVVVIIGNGPGQPYYPQPYPPPYPYPYPPVVYGEPSLYPAYRPPAYVNGYNNGGYNNGGYYNGYRPYVYGPESLSPLDHLLGLTRRGSFAIR